MSLGASGVNYSVERADELFEQHRQQIARNTDRLFARLMFFQWIAGILMALFVAPLTWAGQSSQVHTHVWAAIFLGGAISIFPIWMTRAWPDATINRYVIAVAQMLMSALLITLTGGRIETHFHVFGSLVILSFYRDWRVLIPATIVVPLGNSLEKNAAMRALGVELIEHGGDFQESREYAARLAIEAVVHVGFEL